MRKIPRTIVVFQTRAVTLHLEIRSQMIGQSVPQRFDVAVKFAQQNDLRYEPQLLGGKIENIAFIRQHE